ncbi:MAG: hypothetical protein K2X48_17665 [Chitinophagaceae bacterium]|nr:hypothetical protein [Chitinophagaceae bacterium]
MLKAINLGQQLTKKEMKEVKGGGPCCARLDDMCGDCGSTHQTCGLSMAEAKREATRLAIMADNNGYGSVRGMWCCASC